MELSALTMKEVASVDLDGAKLDGVVYCVRMAGAQHATFRSEVFLRSAQSLPADVRAKMASKELSNMEAASHIDPIVIARASVDISRVFLRTCLLDIKGITIDGQPLKIDRSGRVDVCGSSMPAVAEDQMQLLDAGDLGRDFESLAQYLIAGAGLNDDEKKA